ncbi:DUF551 domain-containing protein [Escherichia coli]|uniref:DUF551 domain-containing protein n=1 Tax=Escherichia coli TaxID=562 RepID=UPI001CDC916F|nr:DUF551 domain-containing protein [Escherichia coli]
MKQLIESEIGDFFAGFGHPGEPETPEEMQSQLLVRVMPLLAVLEQEPVHQACKEAGVWVDVEPDDVASLKANGEQVMTLYAAPRLPHPAPFVPEEMTPVMMRAVQLNSELGAYAVSNLSGAYDLFSEFWKVACRAAMLQGKSEQPQNAQQNIPENIPGGNSPGIPDGWISCSERMPVIGELNWRTSFPLLVTCEIGVIPAYYGFVSVNGDRHYGFMESLKYGDDSGGHPQTNEYGLISNVTHWMSLPEPPQEVKP